MIGVETLVGCVNTAIQSVANTDELGILQLSSIVKDFDSNTVYAVANVASLPSAACNKGRMIFITDRCAYRISDGTRWINDFTSNTVTNALYAWGTSLCGALGDGTTVSKSSPVSVVGGFTDWCQVCTGQSHTTGLRTNGTIWAWGTGSVGELGDGTTVSKSSPVSVVGGFTDWCQISASSCSSIGIRTTGSLWSWGSNAQGQLGDGTTVNRSSPVSVVGGFTDWCRISTGAVHGLGIRTNGTAWAWGFNLYGRLGDGTTVSKSSPVSVVGGFTDWCQISAGLAHGLGVRTNGTAWAWGQNCRAVVGATGALGDGTTVNKSSPVSVVGGFTDWCQVSAGTYHSLGVRTNGTAWAWGHNCCGRLGDGTTVTKSSPISVIGGFTDWCQISAGQFHSAGVRTNGTAWGWGCACNGRLGDGTTVDKSSPVSVLGGIINWCQVSAGTGTNGTSFGIVLGKGFAAI